MDKVEFACTDWNESVSISGKPDLLDPAREL